MKNRFLPTVPVLRITQLAFLSLLVLGLSRPLHAQFSAVHVYAVEHSHELASLMQSAPLADAVLRLAESRQLEIAYAPELLEGKNTECTRPPTDNEAALRCVLGDSGLIATPFGDGMFVIQKPDSRMALAHGSIVGTIRNHDSGARLAYAHVILNETPYSTASGPDGSFHIDRVPPGKYDVQVSMVGYEPEMLPGFRVEPGQPNEIDLELTEATVPMDEVLIMSKKRNGLSMPDSLDPLAYQGFHFGNLRGGLFMSASPSKVNGVQFGGLGSMARDSLRGVQFSGVFNSAHSATGAQFGGVFNTITGNLKGYQFSGVLNQLGGRLQGGQFAGTFNQASDIQGVQFSGIANFADGHIQGVQATGIVNVSGNIRGAQMAGVANRAIDQHGFQGAGILNYAITMQGFQGSGVINVNAGDASGVQAAGVVNYNGGTIKGAQLSGVLNVAGHKQGGVQIGLVNVSKTNTGVPIGFFSFVQETGVRLDTWVDERGMASSAIRTGNRWFSNYIGVSGRLDNAEDNGAILMGLGGEFTHGKRFYSTLDGLYNLTVSDEEALNEHLVQLRATFGFKVFRHIALFGGPSLNLQLSDNPDSTLPLPNRFIDRGTWGSTNYRLWTGFALGLRLSTNRL